MKKILFSLLLIVLIVSSCGSKEQKEETTVTVCILEEGDMKLEQEIIPDGKMIEKITITGTGKGALQGASQIERRAQVKEVEESFGEYKGVEMEVSLDKDDMVMIISMEVDKLEEFPPVLESDLGVDEFKETTYKEYVRSTKLGGATCKEVTK